MIDTREKRFSVLFEKKITNSTINNNVQHEAYRNILYLIRIEILSKGDNLLLLEHQILPVKQEKRSGYTYFLNLNPFLFSNMKVLNIIAIFFRNFNSKYKVHLMLFPDVKV